MARLLLLSLVALSLLTVSAAAFPPTTEVNLYTAAGYGGSRLTRYPSPLTPCVNLNTFAAKVRSGKFRWSWYPNNPNYTVCLYVWFYPFNNCVGNPMGIRNPSQTAYPQPAKTTDISNFYVSGHAAIMNARSIGCSFYPDPCVSYGCTDPAAVCSSSLGWSWQGVASQTLQCTCPDGFAYIGGKCTEVCSALQCPAEAPCVVTGVTPACTCPSDFVFDGVSRSCKYIAADRWLKATNAARQAANLAALVWDEKLALDATTWVNALSKEACTNVTVQKPLPTGQTQNTYGTTLFEEPEKAVAKWVAEKANLLPTDPTKCSLVASACVHYLRIVAPRATKMGCAKAHTITPECEGQTKFVCNYA